MEKDYLIHYGVLGMRWGHRKRSVSSGNARPKNTRSKSMSKSKKSRSRSNIKRSRKVNSSKIKQRLKNIDKQKVKAVAKTVAVNTGKAAAVAALGTAGGMLLFNTISSLNNVFNNTGSTSTSTSDNMKIEGKIELPISEEYRKGYKKPSVNNQTNETKKLDTSSWQWNPFSTLTPEASERVRQEREMALDEKQKRQLENLSKIFN